ncbi:MAG: oligosaccharide flippase family protein [Bacteroidetes bacterium]|nr:oligosaccharide flippase family protein [Bacteroidota bacterium]
MAKSYWLKSGFFTLAERGSSLLLGVGTFMMLARALPKESYGTWMLYLSVYSFIEVARIGLLKNPLIRAAQESGNSFAKTQSTALVINLISGLLVALVLYISRGAIAASWGASGLVGLLEVYAYGFILFSLYSHLDFIQAANMNFRGPSLAIIGEKLVFFSGAAYLFFSQTILPMHFLAYMHLASIAVGILVSLSHGWKYLRLWRKPESKLAASMLAYGKYTLGTNLGAILLRNIDTWMIGWLMNPAAVATYNVAMRVANLFETPTQALAQILFPKAIQEIKKEGSSAFKRLYEKSVALILIPTIPFTLFVLIFASPIVDLLAGKGYTGSAEVLMLTMLFGLLIPFNKQLGILMDADGKARTNMLFVLRNAIINTLINFTLIHEYGVMGAAMATLLTFVLSLFIEQRYAKRHYGVQFIGIFREMKNWGMRIMNKRVGE